jgi:SAM-dependent methyltransferase
MTTGSTDGNQEQIDYWNGDAGARWVIAQQQIDELLQPITDAAFRTAAVGPGSDVIEIGCGCGSTTLALAAQVGPSGSVLGVDVSSPMLAQARARLDAAPARVSLELADASAYAFAPASADLIFSRFGVMFFSDPVAAFANMRVALRPGGRLVFACWQPIAENEWITVPLAAALMHLPVPELPEPGAPGPFSLGDQQLVRSILANAGFQGVSLEDFRSPLHIRGTIEEVMQFYQEIGPLSRLVREAEPEVRAQAVAAVERTLLARCDADGIRFGSASWLVSAAI